MSTAKKKQAETLDAPDTVNNPRFTTVRRGKSRYADKRLELPLSGVRAAVAKTQLQVAAASDIDQGDVSRLERRALEDIELKTLRRYLKALGAELELVAVIGPSRIVLRDPGA